MESLINDLKSNTSSEIHFDSIHKRAYSVDASIYEIEPLGIVIPKSKQDLISIIKIAQKHLITIIPRGAGTGITGGCIGKGLIIDTSKYLNRILQIDYENEFAICEPGVVQDSLNQALASQGYRLGPDTSTGDRATIGGMMANNSAGARSLLYGKMVDHVEEVEMILATGQLLRFRMLSDSEWVQKSQQNNIEGHIYREITRIRENYHDAIDKNYPRIPRRASGYNLDELIKPGPFNICKLITGSEGTLGIATEIKIKISRKPKSIGLCVVHFDDIKKGMQAIHEMLLHHPIALEMIDDQIIEMGKLSPSMRGKLEWLVGNPKMVFAAEFSGNDLSEVKNKLLAFELDMKTKGIGFAHISLTDPLKMNHIWDVRKSGLGLLLSKRTYNRAIAFIEDISIGPDQLPSFMEKFQTYLLSVGKEAGIYGHVGPGCMHVRPFIDLRKKEELNLMQKMMNDVADLVLQHHGALSGEHGDGILRAWLNKKMFGAEVYQAFIELKAAFDPENRMNPGKIIQEHDFLENLRISPETHQTHIDTFLDFSREGGFELSADLCNGNGLCRKKEGTMCPSFQATGDEYDTTRARAQALRAIINGRLPIEDFSSERVHDVLDLCIECKGCKTECPSQVDMAKMKAEFLYHYQEKHGYSLRNRLFGHIGTLNWLASPFASLFNKFVGFRFSKFLLEKIGITSERHLPTLAPQRFSAWFKNFQQPLEKKGKVVLFIDTYTEFNNPHIGKAAVKVLNALGYHVIAPTWQCCGRPLISKGMLKQARKKAATLLQTLSYYAQNNIQIIGLEPSCILTIKDDFQDLISKNFAEKELIHKIIEQSLTFDEFLNNHLKDGLFPIALKYQKRMVKLHGHCHQKSLIGNLPTLNVLKSVPGFQVEEINSGCCGLAGSFGYEKEHYEISMRIGELKLFPSIQSAASNALIVANGISCRTQIKHGTKKEAKHLAEIIFNSIN